MAITDVLPYVGVDEITGDKVGLLKALVAEMIGTLFLVVVGCGSCYANPEPVSDNSLDKGCVNAAFLTQPLLSTILFSIGCREDCAGLRPRRRHHGPEHRAYLRLANGYTHFACLMEICETLM